MIKFFIPSNRLFNKIQQSVASSNNKFCSMDNFNLKNINSQIEKIIITKNPEQQLENIIK